MVALRSKKSIEQEHPAKALRNAEKLFACSCKACYAGSDDLPPLQCLVTKQRAHALNVVERTHPTTAKDASPREQSMSPSTYTLLVSAPEVLTARCKIAFLLLSVAAAASGVVHSEGAYTNGWQKLGVASAATPVQFTIVSQVCKHRLYWRCAARLR